MLFFFLIISAGFAWAQQDPDELWADVNEGWGAPYSELAAHLPENKNFVIWSIIAPKDPLDLRKADNFRQNVSANGGKTEMSISHNLVAWRCELPDGSHYMGATGDSGETIGQTALMVKAGWGLTAFLATFTDGWLSTGFQTGGIFEERSQEEDIYSVAVEVSSQDCSKMIHFLHQFIYHPNHPYRNFGLRVSPEKFEGAGCVSFAAALMKKAGVLADLFKVSERSLWANVYHFGGNDLPLPENTKVPFIPWRAQKNKKVSIQEFFGSNWNAGLKGVKLNLIDPELLVWGIKNLSPELAAFPRKVRHTEEVTNVDHGPKQVTKMVPINDQYDKQAAKASQAARSWKSKMLNQGYHLKKLTLMGQPFLLFKR
jgi:hypothetical protein